MPESKSESRKNYGCLRIIVLAVSALVFSCAKSELNRDEGEWEAPPEKVSARGLLTEPPTVQKRTLGGSKLLVFSAQARFPKTAWGDFQGDLRLEKHQTIRLAEPDVGECVVSQTGITQTSVDPVEAGFTLWAWENQPKFSACEALFEQLQQKGFRMVLSDVPVRGLYIPVKELVLSVLN
ncbi:hypothetical protein K2X33_15015 [bacterium]|nr:hypothetical protein [bacterium]